MHKNQKGFAHLGIITVVLLIAIIGLVGWRVWDAHKAKTSPVTDSQVTTSTKPSTASSAATTVPDGFINYKDTVLDFNFDYPKAWGDVVASKQTPENEFLTFSANSKASIDAVSPNYVEPGMGFECDVPRNFSSTSKPDIAALNADASTVAKDTSYNVSRKFISDGCEGSYSYLTAVHALDGATYGVYVTYNDNLKRVVTQADYDKNIYQFVSQAEQNDFITLVKSIATN